MTSAHVRSASLPALLATACVLAAAAGAAGGGLDTWAVIASKPLQDDGLADLVAAELAKEPGLVLVDRARIREAAGELALEGALDAAGTAARRSLGRVLKADALLVLSDAAPGGTPSVRVVISDTGHGARLWTEAVAGEGDQAPAAARAIAALVRTKRAQYAGGVRQVFGVPPFVSRNLTHEYDYLQAGSAHLLASALASLPGVAVIETEEAHQIRRELDLAGGDVRRMVPLMVEGEFRVADPPAVAEPAVTFRVRVTDGPAAVRTLPERTMPLAQAAAFLRQDLAAEVARLAPSDLPRAMAPEHEFEALVARAETFARTGAWEHATGLREAALLLRPEDAGQRRRALDEHCRAVRAEWPRGIALQPGTEPFDAMCLRRMARWHVAVAHLEYLIRNRSVGAEEACRQVYQVFRSAYSLRGFGGALGLSEAEVAKKRFFREVFPLVFALEGTERRLPTNWLPTIQSCALPRYEGNYSLKEDLDFRYDLLEHVIPDSEESFTMLDLDGIGPDHFGKSPGFSQAEYSAFIERLKASKRPRNAIVGRYLELRMRWLKARAAGEPMADLLAPAESLAADVEALVPDRGLCGYYRTKVTDLAKYIQRAVHPPAKRPPFVYPPRPERSFGRLAFEEIPLEAKRRDGKTVRLAGLRWPAYGRAHVQVIRWDPCGEGLDVLWQSGVLLFMHRPGLAEEVLADTTACFEDVQWDGRDVWVGTRFAGVWVLSPDGAVAARIGRGDGLPPADQGILLHPVAPGKVCAIGSFGPNKRAWCALVERSGAAARVRVFHEATAVPLHEYGRQDVPPDPGLAFTPQWVHEYHPPQDQKARLLLVGRYAPTMVDRQHPLCINLDTLEVSVFQRPIGGADHYRSCSYFNKNGHLFEAGDGGITTYAPPGYAPAGTTGARLLLKTPGSQKTLLDHDGWLYVPGVQWNRINKETLAVELLNQERLPQPYESLRYFGVSAHYGVVAWGYEHPDFHRVTVAPEDGASDAPAPPDDGAKSAAPDAGAKPDPAAER